MARWISKRRWPAATRSAAALKSIKEQLRALPNNGLGYGLLRYLNPQTAPQLAGHAAPQIGFNYLGRLAAPGAADWAFAEEAVRLGGGDPAMPLAIASRSMRITLDAADGPKLVADWSFAPALIAEDEVHDLAQSWFRALEALVRHAAQPGAGGRTPCDLPLVALSQAEIERLESTIRGSRTSCRCRRCRRACCSMRFMMRRRRTSIRSSWSLIWKARSTARRWRRRRRR